MSAKVLSNKTVKLVDWLIVFFRNCFRLFGPSGISVVSFLRIIAVLGIVGNLVGLGLYLTTLKFISASSATTLMTSQVAMIYVVSVIFLNQPILIFKVDSRKISKSLRNSTRNVTKLYAPVFRPNYCALSSYPTIDWLIGPTLLEFFLNVFRKTILDAVVASVLYGGWPLWK